MKRQLDRQVHRGDPAHKLVLRQGDVPGPVVRPGSHTEYVVDFSYRNQPYSVQVAALNESEARRHAVSILLKDLGLVSSPRALLNTKITRITKV